MKKIIYLLMVMLSSGPIFTSCSSDDDDNTTTVVDNRAQIYEFKNVTFSYNSDGYFYFNDTFKLYEGEHILIYMHSDIDANGNYSWVLLPNDFYYYDGTNFLNLFANYEFTSSQFDVNIKPGTNALPSQIYNLTFRVVIIPGVITSKASSSEVDFSSYESVIKYYGLNESKIKVITGK